MPLNMLQEEESVVVFGTPLEPLDDKEHPTKKPIQLQDQKVYDENGLQRFHGAFTGGFSAGYFNTVGTKEGWAPTEFISSRGQKADKSRQRPEDFMDAEDLREYGIAPMRVQATEHFRKEVTAQPKLFPKESEVIPGLAPLADIIRPVSESMGVVLLRQLGWRPGQGIGPRRKIDTSDVKVYGCALPSSVPGDGDQAEHELASNYTFAPRDISVLPYTPKDNVHGLGYVPLDRSQLTSVSSMLAESISGHVGRGSGKRKIAFRGQAFGVGAFEDDDEDIYGKDDITRYDFVLGGEAVVSTPDAKCHASGKSKRSEFGQSCLIGFIAASFLSNPEKKHFPPPVLPPGYKPKNHQGSPASVAVSAANPGGIGRGRFINRFAFSAVDRVKMLGNRFQDTASQKEDQPIKQKTSDETTNSLLTTTKTEWEKDNAITNNARLVLPTVLNTRFVSSSLLEETDTPYGLSQPSSSLPKGELKQEPPATVEQKCQRLIEEWHPIPLLCKRFNVINPYPQSTAVGTLANIAKNKSSQKPSLFRSLFDLPVAVEERKIETISDAYPEEVEVLENADGFNEVKEATTEWEQSQNVKDITAAVGECRPPTPPTMDLFKAIFQDSSSDDSSQSENESNQVDAQVVPDPVSSKTKASTTISEPPPQVDPPVETITPVTLLDPNLYGPSLPPAGSVPVSVLPLAPAELPSTSRDVTKKRGLKRKRSYHKKHKKHKKKKSKRVKASSDSESDADKSHSCSDVEINMKLIKRLKEMKKSR